MTPRLKEFYLKEIQPALKTELGFKNLNMGPRIEKIILNMGLGLEGNDSKVLKSCEEDLAKIAGQKPVTTKFKKSVANFKTRKGSNAGLKVTLRKNKMYEFLDRLVNIALPRIKDFRGLSPNGFDKFGNYTFGVKEHIIFPEVSFDRADKVRGLDIVIVISSLNKDHSFALLQKMNFPFIKKGLKVKILAGKDKAKEGEVIEIDRSNNRAKVKDLNMIKKHVKTTKEKKGGIFSKENFIHISNLKLVNEQKKTKKTEAKK